LAQGCFFLGASTGPRRTMGATAACCTSRDEPEEKDKFLAERRRSSWQSLPDPEEILSFFDCDEDGDTAAQEPTPVRRLPSERFQPATRKPTWHCLKGETDLSERRLACVPEDTSPESGPSEQVLQGIIGHVREVWVSRSTSGNLSQVLQERLKDGFPELEEWTSPVHVRRMMRAINNDEKLAGTMLINAIEFRLRDRELYRSMRCPVHCDVRVIGMDRDEHPVVYMCSLNQVSNFRDISPQIYLAFEAAVRITKPGGQVVFIVDMKGFQTKLNMDRGAIKDFADSFGTIFADVLNFVLVIDFNFLAQVLWKVCQPLLSERTRKKISFANEARARDVIRERLQPASAQRVLSSFDINRDQASTVQERDLHAKRTSICDVPLGIPTVNEAG